MELAKVGCQMAVRRFVAALLAIQPAPAAADKCRVYRELAGFLSATARDLRVLAACEAGIAAAEAGDSSAAASAALEAASLDAELVAGDVFEPDLQHRLETGIAALTARAMRP